MTDSSLRPLIDAIDQADSPERLVIAVQALAATPQEAAIPTLIQVLGFNNPAAAAIAVKGLIQRGAAAVVPLLTLLDEYNYGARAYAIRALAAIADPRALEVLVSAAETDFAPSVRRAATRGLGSLQWNQLAPDAVQSAQQRVMSSLLRVACDPDWSLRYAAVVGLQALAIAALRSQILVQFHQMLQDESDPAVQMRVKWAIATLSESADPGSIPVPTPTSL